jgi:hypothetical protein
MDKQKLATYLVSDMIDNGVLMDSGNEWYAIKCYSTVREVDNVFYDAKFHKGGGGYEESLSGCLYHIREEYSAEFLFDLESGDNEYNAYVLPAEDSCTNQPQVFVWFDARPNDGDYAAMYSVIERIGLIERLRMEVGVL